ncbi:polycomb group protein FIE1-like, partial [Glycine soja]|uniref:polycomb group protein FIE1-like n=1 Tax=Glycine soja TaxID=3848 RepID=UPI000719225C
PVVGSLIPAKKKDYRVTNRLQEGKRPLYAIVFNVLDSRYLDVFATVGGNRVTVYQCLKEGVIAVLQSYVDEDIFVGHGDSINEVKAQILNPSLVVSASKDESIRLWNAHTGIYILIFAGARGHRNEVLSVSFGHVEKSSTWTYPSSKFPTKFVQFPSVDNEMILWGPKVKEQTPGEGVVDVLHKYPIPDCNIWFIKFSCDFHFNIVAVGRAFEATKIPSPYLFK